MNLYGKPQLPFIHQPWVQYFYLQKFYAVNLLYLPIPWIFITKIYINVGYVLKFFFNYSLDSDARRGCCIACGYCPSIHKKPERIGKLFEGVNDSKRWEDLVLRSRFWIKANRSIVFTEALGAVAEFHGAGSAWLFYPSTPKSEIRASKCPPNPLLSNDLFEVQVEGKGIRSVLQWGMFLMCDHSCPPLWYQVTPQLQGGTDVWHRHSSSTQKMQTPIFGQVSFWKKTSVFLFNGHFDWRVIYYICSY